ncbi:uncharacterized protein, YigZ family [Sporobacter termitidis DSM 10068]|uniref:Uncharacterized protein, YigZ family n=1 Tax=Sporobacter termitidis DSM 10068 TaxID=1123282 RepID=A0A1M5X689_9FIRM|nr:YigZ family protein [Sporobacter termitidis]SHH95335.1 uncharacterized protein, YigZ family [Sporobacter termitidis DSM 10068]
MEYLVPSGYGEAELVEKRSRFIGRVWPVETEEEARARIAETKAKYYDARHNCWCYALRGSGDGPVAAVRYADDGEPQGTAGQPMLEVFRRGGVDNFLCVVTRYFGGVLLGAGGLTRAYAATAKLALDAAGIAELRRFAVMELVCPYHLFERIKNEIESFGGTVDSAAYAADVTVTALFREEEAPRFAARLADMTSGAVLGQITGSRDAAVRIG